MEKSNYLPDTYFNKQRKHGFVGGLCLHRIGNSKGQGFYYTKKDNSFSSCITCLFYNSVENNNAIVSE